VGSAFWISEGIKKKEKGVDDWRGQVLNSWVDPIWFERVKKGGRVVTKKRESKSDTNRTWKPK